MTDQQSDGAPQSDVANDKIGIGKNRRPWHLEVEDKLRSEYTQAGRSGFEIVPSYAPVVVGVCSDVLSLE